MDFKSYVSIEIEKSGNKYSFVMPVGAPFGQAYDACFEALGHIIDFSKKAAEQAKQTDTDSSAN